MLPHVASTYLLSWVSCRTSRSFPSITCRFQKHDAYHRNSSESLCKTPLRKDLATRELRSSSNRPRFRPICGTRWSISGMTPTQEAGPRTTKLVLASRNEKLQTCHRGRRWQRSCNCSCSVPLPIRVRLQLASRDADLAPPRWREKLMEGEQ